MNITKPERQVNTVFVHCSASDNPNHDDVSVMRKWHTDPPKGWTDVGYHFFIKKDGTVQKGRSLESIPAAQYGHNTGSIAICLHGLKVDKFTDKQFISLRKLCDDINSLYNYNLTFRGHKEVAAKECPVFDYKTVLNLDTNKKMPKLKQEKNDMDFILKLFKSRTMWVMAALAILPALELLGQIDLAAILQATICKFDPSILAGIEDPSSVLNEVNSACNDKIMKFAAGYALVVTSLSKVMRLITSTAISDK